MPEYLAPGVYVEETSFRSKSIEGVSTTTTGFVGPCRYGPVTEPADVITSLGEFERTYAGGDKLWFAADKYHATNTTESDNFLWHAVRAFFTEGGKRLYIARTFRPLQGEYSPDFADSSNFGSPANPLYADGHGRSDLGEFHSDLGEFTFRSRFPGAASNLIVTLTIKAGPNILGAGERIPASPPFYLPKFGALSERDIVVLNRISSPPEGVAYLAEFNAAANQWRFRDEHGDLKTVEDLDLTVDPSPLQGDAIYVLTASIGVFSKDGIHSLGTWTDLPLDPAHERGGMKDSLFAKFKDNPATITEARTLPLIISLSGITNGLGVLQALKKVMPDLLDRTTADAKRGLDTLGKKLSRGVITQIELKGGNDGLRPGASEYEGTDDENQPFKTGLKPFKTGLKQFEDVEDISIVAAPGSTADYKNENSRDDANAIFGHLIAHAERMRYRIAVLDCPPGQGIADVRNVRAKLDSTYAAFYYPWVRILDPVTRRELDLPPSGFVSGIYARNDINRAVYKAPANEVVNLAIGFETLLNKAQQEVLNPLGINCFRFFEGRGFRLWGARTISSDPEWKYVNLRRYFAYLERSIDKGTQWAVFEPNGERLWANVRRTIEDFLLNEWQSGALLGDKPEKAYFVRCDRSTMTQNDLDNGRLVCLVGVAPLYPAEFVIFRIGQWTADRKS
jgi:phage tail sheath protein FI